jgi:membrane protein YqaA with SNARE-associated domain
VTPTVAIVAASWGFAEATLFFLVPDIYLSLVAVGDAKAGFRACAVALAGALLGGALMYAWGSGDATGAEVVLDAIPAIDVAMIDGVRRSLGESGLAALFLGPLSGVPYKIYAVESGALGLGIPLFLLISIPARGVRFVLVTGITASIARGPLAAWPMVRKRTLAILFWTGFYAFYFAVKGW